MLSRGVPIYKVSKILEHSSVVVTEQHYGHLDRSVLTEEIKHIEGIVTLPKLAEMRLGQPPKVVNEVVKVVNGRGFGPKERVAFSTVINQWRGTQVA